MPPITITDLPNELLLQIFIENFSLSDLPRRPPYYQPLASARLVCRHWDNLVKETPMLWTTLWIKETSEIERPNWKAMLAHVLSRSRNLPLDIVVNTDLEMWKYLPELIDKADRWRLLQFNYAGYTEPRDANVPATLPNLITLNINVPAERYHVTVVLDTPRLENLFAPYATIEFLPGCYPPLKMVDLVGDFNEEEMYRRSLPLDVIIHAKDSLEELSLCPEWAAADYPNDRSRVSFPLLKSLRLDHWRPTIISMLTNSYFPSLRYLEIFWTTQDVPQSPIPILPQLQELHWQNTSPEIHDAPLGILLGACPDLRIFSSVLFLYPGMGTGEVMGGKGDISPFVVTGGNSAGVESVVYCPLLEDIRVEVVGLELLDRLTELRPNVRRLSMSRFNLEDCGWDRKALLPRCRTHLRRLRQRVAELKMPSEEREDES